MHMVSVVKMSYVIRYLLFRQYFGLSKNREIYVHFSRSKSRSPRRNRSRSKERGWERSRSPTEKPRRPTVNFFKILLIYLLYF